MTDNPSLVSNEVSVTCIRQKLEFPDNSASAIKQALKRLHEDDEERFPGIFDANPGITFVSYTRSMKELRDHGSAAIPALLANIGVFAIQHQIVQILGDLHVLLSGVEHKQRIWTNRLFNAVPARKHASPAEYDNIEGRAGRVMLANRLLWLQSKQDRMGMRN
jgi:hypothetical protein